jgi:sulfate-transporting ATPase
MKTLIRCNNLWTDRLFFRRRSTILMAGISNISWNVQWMRCRCPDSSARVNVLSGGERRRVALCRLLLQQPDILLLDEPTNHLDAESVQWLETTLKQYNGTVICITHDRYFLDNVAGWILELDRGKGFHGKGTTLRGLNKSEKA